jgi:DNA-binding GntR family transcriptional regulator
MKDEHMSHISGITRVEPNISLREKVEKAIAAAIISGQMMPGEVFSVPTLAAQFDVSATPVREAMLNLEQRGFVAAVRNKGFRVTEVDDETLAQIAGVRQLLEPAAIAQLALVFEAEQAPEARRLADRIVEGAAGKDLAGYLAADTAFHALLTVYTGNHVLVDIVSDLRARTRLIGLRDLLGSERLAVSAREHHAIVDLLEAHDADGVRELMRRHIGHVHGWWSGRDEVAPKL